MLCNLQDVQGLGSQAKLMRAQELREASKTPADLGIRLSANEANINDWTAQIRVSGCHNIDASALKQA